MGRGEGTPDEVGRRWRAARRRLAEAGAPAGTLDAIEAVVADPARAAPGRALFARDGRVTFTAPLGAAPRREIARVGQLPHLMPLLVQRPPAAQHLRAGAGAGRERAPRPAGEPPPGRRSPDRRSRHSRPVDKAARAGALVLDHLPSQLKPRALGGSGKPGADRPAVASRLEYSITARTDRESHARFGEWQARRSHSGTVEGLPETLAALRESQVSDLFVADRLVSTAMVWIGPDGADLAASVRELRERGVADPVPERADAAIVRALAATDAELHFLPEDVVAAEAHAITFPRDGICATLRWGEAR